MSEDLFRRTRPFNQLDDFFTDWSKHLKRCLPPLTVSPTDAKNKAVLDDLNSYYDTLDHYANKDTILYFLSPTWRSNPLETTILLLGDINPRLFTSLIKSFIDDDDQDPVHTFRNLAAWEELSSQLGNTINGTVSRLQDEMTEAQDRFVRRFSDKWVSSFRLHAQSETVVMETATSVTTEEEEDGGGGAMIMEELVRIFREANQLRKDTITSIGGVLNMNQIALFLVSVCKLLAGFKHQDQAFQNSLFDNHLINQQLPKPEQLLNPLDPSGEFNIAHHNYPQPMMQQQLPQLPPGGHQLLPPFAPFGLAIARPNHPPPMMQQFAPHAVPPHFPHFARPGWVMMQQVAPLRPPPPPPMMQQQEHVIYVGNLAPEATDGLLLQEFSHYRSAWNSKICVAKGNGYTYGFVSFGDERDKIHAMQVMNSKIFLGKEMDIGPAAKNSI